MATRADDLFGQIHHGPAVKFFITPELITGRKIPFLKPVL